MSSHVVTIFGGTGFIGRHVIQRLVRQGAVIRVPTRDTEAANYLKPMGEIGQIAPIPCDITDKASVKRAIDGSDQVINLIGILAKSGRSTFDSIHVEAARTIAEAATEAGVRQLVHVSALGASADSPALYARTKAAGEEAVKSAFDGATIVRPSAIFGSEDNFFNMFASLARLTPVMPVFGCPLIPKPKLFGLDTPIDFDFYGDGGTKLQPVFVGDVAAAIIKILDTPSLAGQTYELGGPKVYSFKAMLDLVLKVSGRPRLLLPYPFALAKFFAFFLEFLPKPLLTRDQVELLKTDNIVSGDLPGFKELELTPTSAEAILPTYLRRYRPTAKRHLRDIEV